MNTRTFSRNSVLAFPKTVEYASAIERPMDREDSIVVWACAVAALVLVAMTAVGWL